MLKYIFISNNIYNISKMKSYTFFWVLPKFPIISTHYGIYILKVNCMKKLIALIAMLSVAFLASCTKEEVTTEATPAETPVVEVETMVETEVATEGEATVETEVEMNTEVEATIDMVEDAMEEISVEAEMNTEAEMVK